MLFKRSSTKSFHIAGSLIEVLFLVLVSFNLSFEKSKLTILQNTDEKSSRSFQWKQEEMFLYELYA